MLKSVAEELDEMKEMQEHEFPPYEGEDLGETESEVGAKSSGKETGSAEEIKKEPEPPKKVQTADASVQTHNQMSREGVLAKKWILDDEVILRKRGRLQPGDRVVAVNDSKDSHLHFILPRMVYTAWGTDIGLDFIKSMGV